MYYLVRKFECISDEVVDSLVGYLTSVEDKDSFEAIHGQPFVDWVDANPTVDMCDYFDTNDPFYLIDSVVAEPTGLSIITNLENPEEA